MEKLLQKYKNEIVFDKKGFNYVVVIGLYIIDNQPTVMADVINPRTKRLVGTFYGSTKKDTMKEIKNNIDIMIYDMD